MNSLQNFSNKEKLFQQLAASIKEYPTTIEAVVDSAKKLKLPKAIMDELKDFRPKTSFESADHLVGQLTQIDIIEQAFAEAPEEHLRNPEM